MTAICGVVVEYYDWLLWGLLAPVFARVFFDFGEGDAAMSFIYVWGVFAVGMFFRPLGGLFFGWFGTRYGRKRVLIVTTVLMSGTMILAAVTPAASTWPILAPLIIVMVRAIQGFSVGGEYSGSVVYLAETAPAGRRGVLTNAANGASGFGAVVAGLVVLVLYLTLDASQMDSWGWRIAYGIGGLTAILALFMRRNLRESDVFEELSEHHEIDKKPLRSAVKNSGRPILLAVLLVAFAQFTFYFLVSYLPTYLVVNTSESTVQGILVVIVTSAVFGITAPWCGALADRFGRRRMMIGSALFMTVLIFPALAMLKSGNPVLIWSSAAIFLIGAMFYWGGFSPAVTELFTSRYRMAGMGIGYNLGSAIFGGTLGIVLTSLGEKFGGVVGPGLYLSFMGAVTAFIAWRIKETAFEPLRGEEHSEDSK